jgi:hypothetical protein
MLPIRTAKKSSTRDRPSPQSVDALKLECQRREQCHQRRQIQILLDRRITARDRNQSAFKADTVGEDECPDGEQRVGDDVKGDEETVVTSYHLVPIGALSVSSITACICST